MKTISKPSTLVGFIRQHQIVSATVGSFLTLCMVVLALHNAFNTPRVYKNYETGEIVSVVAADGTKLPKKEPFGAYETVWTDATVEVK